MAGHNRRPNLGGRGQIGTPRVGRKHRQRQPTRRNRWFALLNAAAARDLAERGNPPNLSRDQILAWADTYHACTGHWPKWDAGRSPSHQGRPGWPWRRRWCWASVAARAAQRFSNCWPSTGGAESASTRFHDRTDPRLGRRLARPNRPAADYELGNIPGAEHITWKEVDDALREGRTDRPSGLWLSRLLHLTRGVFRHKDRLPLTEDQILAWADAHYQRTGLWPTPDSGWIVEAPGEAWNRVNQALERGKRGLAGRSSLPRLLAASGEHGTRPTFLAPERRSDPRMG